jgi:16S rRNA (cytosine967-C5)-methyltransferase
MDDIARETALAVLNRLDRGSLTLDLILEQTLGATPRLQRRLDKSLFHALVFGVLRWRGRLDHILSHFSRTALDKIDPPVLNVLRLGLFQILYLDRVPNSAAVNTSVEMTKGVAARRAADFVNAVLRRASREAHRVPFPDLRNQPVKALAARHAFPKWLVKRWLDRGGLKETEALCRAINVIPPLTLRVNELRVGRERLMAALTARGVIAQPGKWSDAGIRTTGPSGDLAAIPAFQKGWFQVQDEAAQLVTLLLSPRPGERVLDACAGRGGKSAHAAQCMADSGRLLAVDRHPGKLARLAAEMKRLGITIVKPLAHDWHETGAALPGGGFDRILLDAPCSGLGVLRRNPDSKWSTAAHRLRRLQRQQLQLLDRVAPCLKPGGILVYAVCSTEPEETTAVLESFIRYHPGYRAVGPGQGFPEGARALVDGKGFLRTSPHPHGLDGFFAVRIRKTAGAKPAGV